MITVSYKIRNKKGEVVNEKQFYIGTPRYKKSVKWAAAFDVAFAAVCLADAYRCVQQNSPKMAILSAAVTVLFFFSRGMEIGVNVKEKEGAVE